MGRNSSQRSGREEGLRGGYGDDPPPSVPDSEAWDPEVFFHSEAGFCVTVVGVLCDSSWGFNNIGNSKLNSSRGGGAWPLASNLQTHLHLGMGSEEAH